MKRLLLAIFVLTFFCPLCNAQSSYQMGLLPSFNLNKKLPKDWKLNFKTESRQILKEGLFEEQNAFDYRYVLTDVSFVASQKVGLNNSLAGGYLIRLREEAPMHRFIQQFTITRKIRGFRLAHRFSSDQSFEAEENVEIRLRYRISMEFALNGQDVNRNEFYLKLNNEYLNSFQEGEDYDLEIRLVAVTGYSFTDSNKLESGLDYRLSSFLNEASRNRFWVVINWYLAI